MTETLDNALYRMLYRIRRFEETVLENFPRGVFFGTTHTYLGQEADAAGVLSHLQPQDIVFSNHRCHGHFLAYGGDPRALFAEMMGKASGVCGGRGGSQHLHWRNFYSNGVQGGIAPVATGMALAEKFKHSGAVCVVFLGDGTLGAGCIVRSAQHGLFMASAGAVCAGKQPHRPNHTGGSGYCRCGRGALCRLRHPSDRIGQQRRAHDPPGGRGGLLRRSGRAPDRRH